MKLFLAACLIASPAAAFAETAPGSASRTAHADFIDASGAKIGTATLKPSPNGVLIEAKLSKLPPGVHAFHIHEKGVCDAADGFKSAGGHYGAPGSKHGFMTEHGPHAGDVTNQTALADGTMTIEAFNDKVTIEGGAMPLLDADGSSLVLHAKPDDYASQPAGDAGGRIACAVIKAD
ncbi:superoxide dismutase family protein [Methylocella sp.]|uniref:superoxide dismutase family protein n=1 Tax=Methylocella sp. TaxID=1978226 RepID=UPI003784E38B